MGRVISVLRRHAGLLRGVFAFVVLAFAAAEPALAQSLTPVDTFFTNIGTALTGTTGQAVALVALCAIGLLFMMGRMNLAFALSIAIGIAILFGAATILSGFSTA